MKINNISTIHFEDPNLPGVRKPFLSIFPNGNTQVFDDLLLPPSFTLSTEREVCFLSQHYEKDSNGKTREVMSFRGTLDSDLVLALTRPTIAERLRARARGFKAGGYDFRYACLLSGIACERCLNVLLYQHGSKHGYALHSKEWKDCPTQCELCEDEPKFELKNRSKLTLVAALLLAGCSSPDPAPFALELPARDAATFADAGSDAAISLNDASNDAAAALTDAVGSDAGNDAGDAEPPDAVGSDASSDAAADIPSTLLPDATAQLSETTSSITDAATDTDAAIFSPDAGSDAATCPIPAARGSECDLVTSCGCAEGFVCRTADLHTGQTLCFTAGSKPTYSACEFDQDCAVGNVCEGGLCRPPCDTPETLCSDDSWCGKLRDDGRTVCLGNCNVMPLTVGRWKDSASWIENMQLLHERGLTELPQKTLDYVPCGEGAYCRPGLEGISPFPYCIPSTGTAIEGETCTIHQDCLSGYGCDPTANECRIYAYVDDGCPSGDGSREGFEPTEWLAPNGRDTVSLCIPE